MVGRESQKEPQEAAKHDDGKKKEAKKEEKKRKKSVSGAVHALCQPVCLLVPPVA